MLNGRRIVGSRTIRTAALAMVIAGLPRVIQAQGVPRAEGLQLLNDSVESLVQRVSASVVQVLVTSYGPIEPSNRANTDLVIRRQRSMGSGVIVAADGYIVTNAHVVSHARRVEVVLSGGTGEGGERSIVKERGRTVDATIVGIAPEIDLALLKVDGSQLPAIAMADYDALRQGELVFAFGSPEGLRNSVSMGIVSAVARQTDPDSPLVYIQTDAPINHGNSGGPLVNIKGELVGINTFILSDSGGSQGLGFAIPSALVQAAYPKLRRYGHLHRGTIGIVLQTITPTLASGLGLARDSGAVIADVHPGSPAEAAGLSVGDIVLAIDGKAVDSLPRLAIDLFTRSAGDQVRLDVLRGHESPRVVEMTVAEGPLHFDSLTDRVQPESNEVARLGILGVDIDAENASLAAGLRVPSGVIVVGHTKDESDLVDGGLTTGDAIHAMNGTPILSIADLRAGVDALKPRGPVVLQIERNGQFMFLAFELD